LLQYLWLAYLIEGPLPGSPVTILDAHDVHASRWAAFKRLGITRGLAITARQEQRVLSLADHVVAIQHDDLRTFRESYGLRSVLLAMHAQRLKPLPWQATGQVLFVGSDNLPNVEAARWLISVWPRAAAGLERKVELHLVGSVCSAVDAQSVPGVVVHGRVEDLAFHYGAAELVVNPVSFGSGLKIKTVEALCHGRPLLTTRVGAEGLASFEDESTMRVANDLDSLFSQLREMLHDHSRGAAMSSAALAYAGEHFLPEEAYRSLTDLISGATRTRRANSPNSTRAPADQTAA
jgi:hypothetical protein